MPFVQEACFELLIDLKNGKSCLASKYPPDCRKSRRGDRTMSASGT